jgi:hypothetical protein
MSQVVTLGALALLAAGCTEIDVQNNTAGPIVVFVSDPDAASANNGPVAPGQSYVTLGDQAGQYTVSVTLGVDYAKIVKAKRDKLQAEILGMIVYGTSRPQDIPGLAADVANLQDDLVTGSNFVQCSGTVTDFGTAVVSVTVSNGSLSC